MFTLAYKYSHPPVLISENAADPTITPVNILPYPK